LGDAELKTADVWSLTTKDIPGSADLAWVHSHAKTFPLREPVLA